MMETDAEREVHPDYLTMTDAQLRVLERMADDLGFPFRDIASDTGVPEAGVRRIIRRFHEVGMVGYGPLFSEDGPAICGKGYWLVRKGWEAQTAARNALPPCWFDHPLPPPPRTHPNDR